MTDFSNRHTYLGASEVGVALNMGKYQTSHELWLQKTLRAPHTPHKDIFDRGHRMEDVMVEILKDRYEIEVSGREVEYVNPGRSWLLSHVDGVIPQDSPHIGDGEEVIQDGPGIVEFKAPGEHMVSEYRKSGLPGEYLLQLQINMLNSGCKWGVMILMDYTNWDLVCIYHVFDKPLVVGCLSYLDVFWDRVTKDIEPPITGEPYRTMGPSGSSGESVKDDNLLAAELAKCDEVFKHAKAELDSAKGAIKDAMVTADTDHTILHGDDGWTVGVTWRESRPTVTVDGKSAVLWAEQLVGALMANDSKLVKSMAKVFEVNMFDKQRAGSRRFTYKIKE